MAPHIVAVSAILLLLAAPGPQTSNPSNQLQTVSIVLPKETKSETVQIRYMLSGPFGGYGSHCGHEQVPHGDHVDYLVGDHLHHVHGNHCDSHGHIEAQRSSKAAV